MTGVTNLKWALSVKFKLWLFLKVLDLFYFCQICQLSFREKTKCTSVPGWDPQYQRKKQFSSNVHVFTWLTTRTQFNFRWILNRNKIHSFNYTFRVRVSSALIDLSLSCHFSPYSSPWQKQYSHDSHICWDKRWQRTDTCFVNWDQRSSRTELLGLLPSQRRSPFTRTSELPKWAGSVMEKSSFVEKHYDLFTRWTLSPVSIAFEFASKIER